VVKIFVFLDLAKTISFLDGHYIRAKRGTPYNADVFD